jgi:hypothetical protein
MRAARNGYGNSVETQHGSCICRHLQLFGAASAAAGDSRRCDEDQDSRVPVPGPTPPGHAEQEHARKAGSSAGQPCVGPDRRQPSTRCLSWAGRLDRERRGDLLIAIDRDGTRAKHTRGHVLRPGRTSDSACKRYRTSEPHSFHSRRRYQWPIVRDLKSGTLERSLLQDTEARSGKVQLYRSTLQSHTGGGKMKSR